MREYHKINSIFKRDEKGKFIGGYSLPEFEYLKNNKWIFTEKIDGTNIRIMWDGNKIKFGGKTDNAQMPVFLFDKLQEIFTKEKMKEIFKEDSVCLYGEGFGARIQKGGGKYIKDSVDFILFDIKIGDWWLKKEDIEDIAKKFGIRVVKVVGSGTLQEAISLVRKGFNSEFGDFIAEGVVLKPEVELFARNGKRIITKIKHEDFK